MIVTYKEDLVGGPRHRKVSTGTSLRMLTREDGVGFSFHDTELEAGTTTTLQYKNHIEANYIIDGTGELENLETGEIFEVRPGMTYTLDKLSYSLNPPVVFAVVDFDHGGRLPIELTDVDAAEVAIGGRVEMTFRKLFTADGVHNYFWKARPIRGEHQENGAS